MFRKLIITSVFIAIVVSLILAATAVVAGNQDQPRRQNRRNQDEPERQGAKNARRANPNSPITSSQIGAFPLTQAQMKTKASVRELVLRPEKVAKLRNLPGIEKVVQFRGNRATPLNRYKFTQLLDGNILISQGGVKRPMQDSWIGRFGDGWMFVLCSCGDENAPADDCKLKNGDADGPGQCVGSCDCTTRTFFLWDNSVFEEVILGR